jgi:hypothetical protein
MSPEKTLSLIQRAAERGVTYLNVYIFAWKITPGQLLELVKQLGDEFELVTPGQLLDLLSNETQLVDVLVKEK